MERAYLTGKFYHQTLVLTLALSQKSNVGVMLKGAASFLCISIGNTGPPRKFGACSESSPSRYCCRSVSRSARAPRKGAGLGLWCSCHLLQSARWNMIWIEGRSRYGSSPAVNGTSLRGYRRKTFAAFRAAFAKGRYFNDHIRNNFRYRLVASDSDPG